MQQLSTNTILHGHSYNYTIDRALGQGSFGITYLAKVQMQGALGTLDSNMKVAIKEFFMRDINGRKGASVTIGSQGGIFADYRKKFAHEAENLARLSHPNIVRVLESFEENNTIYYVMEYIDGGSLDDYILQKGHLGEDEAIGIACQIGSALSFMHSHKMLHLDLKPGNIMRKQDGTVVLIDFGLSKTFDSKGEPESSTTVGGGTPGYAPIEQSTFHNAHDFPVTMDVYAFGATIYKMLVGKKPPVASEVLNDGFPAFALRSSLVSPEVIAIIEKAMMPIKKDRTQSIAEVVNALRALKGLAQDDDASEDTLKTTEKTDTVHAVDADVTPKPAPKPAPKPEPKQSKWGCLKKAAIIIGAFLSAFIVTVIVVGACSRQRTEPETTDWDDDYVIDTTAVDSVAEWDELSVDTVAAIFDEEDEMQYDGVLNGHRWMDLGLPSHKKWATCNIGASSPTATGDYFAWGRVEAGSRFSSSDQIYYSSKDLTPSHDAATRLWGAGWSMPTEEEVDELIAYCRFEFASGGVIFIGPNGHKIYLPYTGTRCDETLENDTDRGCYWTSTPEVTDDATYARQRALTMALYDDDVEKIICPIYCGLNIRPVH